MRNYGTNKKSNSFGKKFFIIGSFLGVFGYFGINDFLKKYEIRKMVRENSQIVSLVCSQIENSKNPFEEKFVNIGGKVFEIIFTDWKSEEIYCENNYKNPKTKREILSFRHQFARYKSLFCGTNLENFDFESFLESGGRIETIGRKIIFTFSNGEKIEIDCFDLRKSTGISRKPKSWNPGNWFN